MEDYQAQTTVVDVMLTTLDNPYNPFDDYDKWWQWDKDNDYNTPDGTNVRDYVHPFDLADAHLLAVEYLRKGNESTAFNLGSSTGFSNLQILEAARKVTGKEIPAEKADRRPGDPDTLIASSEKARTVLGWKPQFDNIEKIIASAWAWHSSHPKGYDDRG